MATYELEFSQPTPHSVWFSPSRFPQDSLSSVFGMISTAPYAGALAGTALAIYVQAISNILQKIEIPIISVFYESNESIPL